MLPTHFHVIPKLRRRRPFPLLSLRLFTALTGTLPFVRFATLFKMIYLLIAIGLTPGGSSTVHIYTQTIHRTTQITTKQHKLQLIWKSADRAPSLRVLAWHLP